MLRHNAAGRRPRYGRGEGGGARAARPREPPRFEPLTFGLDRKGTKGQRARLGAAGLSFAVRWVDPLDVARFVGGRPRFWLPCTDGATRSGSSAGFLFHPFNASSARTHKLSLCRQG